MNEQIFIALARTQADAGNMQDALTILTSALKDYPQSADLYIERGRIYNALGNQQAALFDIKKAAEINPDLLSDINGEF